MVKITQGETLQLTAQADAASVVTFYFAGASNQQVVAMGARGAFAIAVNTSTWKPGGYICEIRSVLAGVTSVIARLSLSILPSLTSLPAGADIRTDAEKAVANIEAMLAGGASLEARRYKINNRELERYGVGELMTLLSYWKRMVQRERRLAAGITGLGPRIAAVI